MGKAVTERAQTQGPGGEAAERSRTTEADAQAGAVIVDEHRPGRQSAGPLLLSRHVLALQRTAGNAATALYFQRAKGPQAGRVLQRQLTEEQKQSWEEHKGPEYVKQLKQTAADWKAFRDKPGSYQDLPKTGPAFVKLADLLATGEKAYARHAANEIGAENVKYLSEMTGFVPGARLLVNVVPGLAYVDPAHSYTLKMDEAGFSGFLNKVPMVPVAGYVIEYSNAYGWHWTKHLTGGQLGWSVGVGVEKGKGVSAGGAADVTPQKGLKKIGRGPIPMPGTITVNSNAKATSVGYWGFLDVAGPALIVNGPSAKGTVRGWGVKKVTGGLISLTGSGGGPPGTLDFMNLESAISVAGTGPTGPERPSETIGDDKKGAELSLTLIEGALGVLVGGDQEISIPQLVPTPVPEEKVWRYQYHGFETGSAEVKIPPAEVRSIIDMIRFDVDEKKRSHDSIRPYLEEAGIKEDFKLDFYCEGYASRRWAGAATDADRQVKNQQLSTERAQNVTALLNEVFGPQHAYSFTGRGAAVWVPGDHSQVGEVVPESDKATVDAKLRAYEQRIRDRNRGDFTEDQIHAMVEEHRKSLEARNRKESDIQYARRVNITVTFRGHTITFAAGYQPAPTPVQ